MNKNLTLLVTLIFLFLGTISASASLINFEGLNDSEIVTNQFPGLAFINAVVLTSGISLNEFEFPPHSGTNVVFDDSGPMTINFTTPVSDFGAYFTYLAPLTLSFYDLFNNLEGTVNSAFSSNLALSGDSGSNPNEFLSFVWAPGISKAVISGDPGGSSFTLDDLTSNPAFAVPEPVTILLLGMGIMGMLGYRMGREKV